MSITYEFFLVSFLGFTVISKVLTGYFDFDNKQTKFVTILISFWILDDYSLLLVGGVTKLYMNDQSTSPMSNKVELYSSDVGPEPLPSLPQELIGVGLAYGDDKIIYACGGATWTTVQSDCYSLNLRWDKKLLCDAVSLCLRSLENNWKKIGSLSHGRAFGLMAWLPDEQNMTKLFHIGGLDPKTYEAVIPIEMFDEENGSWDIFRDIPSDQDHQFPESPDHGCLAVDDNFVYSVGLTNIVSLNWNTWEISQVCH